MTKNTVQDPRAIVENIDNRLTLLRHTLRTTKPGQVTEEMLAGLRLAVEDIQSGMLPVMQFAEDRGEGYAEEKAA